MCTCSVTEDKIAVNAVITWMYWVWRPFPHWSQRLHLRPDWMRICVMMTTFSIHIIDLNSELSSFSFRLFMRKHVRYQRDSHLDDGSHRFHQKVWLPQLTSYLQTETLLRENNIPNCLDVIMRILWMGVAMMGPWGREDSRWIIL